MTGWKSSSHPAWGGILRAMLSHTPHGVCGLKPQATFALIALLWSHPAWGVWIETTNDAPLYVDDSVTPRMGCVD